MFKQQRQSDSTPPRFLAAFLATWQRADRLSHHVLTWLFRLAVGAYFLFALLFLSLRYLILPHIDLYKPDIERIAGRVIGSEVKIARIYASWQGLRPNLFLGDVVLRGKDGRTALSLPSVSATLSWWTVPAFDVRFERLEVSRPELEVTRDAAGRLYVAGIFLDPNQPGGKGMDWLLSQHEIVIREGVIHWTDHRRAAPRLSLENVNLLLRNRWRRHQFALQATPPAAFGAPVDVRANFTHPAFTRSIADARLWRGELYTDVRDTDLAAWRAYVNYPLEVERGHGSVRAWLSLDHARLADFTADLTLSDAVARFGGDIEPLQLKRVNGRVSARETIVPGPADGKPTFGALGHSVSVSNFSLETADGLTLPATTVTKTYQPALKGQGEKHALSARLLDLQTLASLAERLPFSPGSRQLLRDYAPRGRLVDFAAQWQGSYPALATYQIAGRFEDLSLRAQPARPARPAAGGQPAQAAVPAIPGFAHLTGRIDAGDKGGRLKLASTGLQLELPGYVQEPVVAFAELALDGAWSFQRDDRILFDVASLRFVQDGLVATVSGKHLMPLAHKPGQSRGTVDLEARIDTLPLASVQRYLPLQTPPHLAQWLGGALKGGAARDMTVKLRGDLADFPFAGSVNAAGRRTFGAAGSGTGDGVFHVAGKLDKAVLEYAPGDVGRDGRSPLWPLAEAIDGSIVFDRTRMEIEGDSLRTNGVALSNVKAVIPDLLSADKLLDITGSAAGPLAGFVGYVNASPVAGWIADFTENTRATGQAKLALKLQLPLARLKEARVQGTLQFLGNEVVLLADLPPMTGTVGKLNFNERGFDLAGVNATLLGGGVAVTGGTQRDGAIAVRAAGSVTGEGIRRNYTSPASGRLTDHISGGTRYALAVNVRNHQADIVIESSLAGLGSTFPAPFRKAAGDALPLRLAVSGLPSDAPNTVRDEIRASLGSTIAIRYLRQKSMAKDAAWRVLRGGIGVNEPAPEPDAGLIANVNLKSLNLDAWRAVATAVGSAPAALPQPGRAGSAGMVTLAQYVAPDVLAAKAAELVVAGKKLDNVVVGASHLKDVWQANIDSAQISGYLTWNEQSSQGMGKATARLTSLVISPAAAGDVTELLEGKNVTTQIPALDIVAERFELFGKKFGRLELVANNVTTQNAREWRVNKLALANPDGRLTATGKWAKNGADMLTSLNYELELDNAGSLLDRFGFANVMRGGKGKMSGDVSWKGVPFELDIPSLTGHIALDLGAGQFLKADPGAAKLLGVLNLQMLPKLLKLDFRDIFSEGLAFTGVTATAAIERGVLHTDNLKMRSVNATVLMDGSADIDKETQNLRAVVIPEFNLGTGSLVYALAVNPVIGLGTFLAQLFLREPVMKALTFQYQITGTWKDPVITKLPAGTPRVADKP
jgi:uncharacterized protein (TIGR02099 family)